MPTSLIDSLQPKRNLPAICVTIGDPQGIGPEIIKKALKKSIFKGKADFLVIGDPTVKGRGENACARGALEAIDSAVKLAMTGRADAIVTGPVSKKAITKAGVRFQGHTEYLAARCGVKKIAMMFISSKLKVSLVTRHIALNKVSRAISIESICDTVALTRSALKDWFGIRSPKIGVSALNPHCGDGGLAGKEEGVIIRPAVRKLQKRFGGIFGPIPADTLLYDTFNKRYDAAVCMYHDQALAAFKMISRDDGVNLTLGLPFIRTSPDHGPGFDIAGSGKANAGSMIEAIRLAIRLVKHRLHRLDPSLKDRKVYPLGLKDTD